MSAYDLNMASRDYTDAIELALQQRGSKFLGTGTMGSYRGERAEVVKLISATEAQEVTQRYVPIEDLDPQNVERWVAPRHFHWNTKYDSFDSLEIFGDPLNKYVEAGVEALNRKIDLTVIGGIYGSNLTGTHGTSTTAFDTTNNQVAVNYKSASASGLSVAKLIKARQRLRANQNNLDYQPVFCAITSIQEMDLLSEIQVVNSQYSGSYVLKDGKLASFLGFNFIHSEYLLTDSNSYRRIPVWCKDKLHIGMWNGIMAKVSPRDDLTSQPMQVYIKTSVGATRTEENGFVDILCSE